VNSTRAERLAERRSSVSVSRTPMPGTSQELRCRCGKRFGDVKNEIADGRVTLEIVCRGCKCLTQAVFTAI